MNPASPDKKDEAYPSLSDFICGGESGNFFPGLLNSQTQTLGTLFRREGQSISNPQKTKQNQTKGFQSRHVNLLGPNNTPMTPMRAAGPIQGNPRDHTGQKPGFIWAGMGKRIVVSKILCKPKSHAWVLRICNLPLSPNYSF